MMKNLMLVLTVVSLGCASGPQKKSEAQILNERLAQSEKERQELREELELRIAQQPGTDQAPAPQGPVGGYQPPAQPDGPMMQNWAWLVPAKGCTRPYLMEIQNDTDGFAQVALDSVDLTIRGGRGMVPGLIRPRSSVFVCLNDVGVHVVEAKIFGAHPITTGTRGIPPRELKPMGTCRNENEYTYNTVGWNDRQLVKLDFKWHCHA